MFFQSTISDRVEFCGVGLHSGKRAKVILHPAPPHTGAVFLPHNRDKRHGIRATIENLRKTNNAITIGRNGFSVATIEHFMASFYALDITNIYIEVEGDEVPILDGSSNEIVKGILDVGVKAQNAFCDIFYVPYPIWIEDDDSYLIVLPNNNFKVTYTIDFSSKSSAIGTQTASYIVNHETFKRSIAPARTFGFFEDIDYMRTNRLALGGSLDNALVYTKHELINDNLRFDNECVRHKILDLVGDVSLVGYKIRGHFIAYKSGHAMDMMLARKIDGVIKKSRQTDDLSEEVKKEELEFKRFKKRIDL